MSDYALRAYDVTQELKRLILSPQHHHRLMTDGSISSSKQRGLGPKISEIVKGKLRLGARILKLGGTERIFRRAFDVKESNEKLLKASPCYLYTTAGPIAGLLFISAEKIAFCSDRSIKFSSPTTGQTFDFYYKVVIPMNKIKRAAQTKDMKRPSEKYLQVVTADEFDFWFMGLLGYKRTFNCLQKALCRVSKSW